MQDQTTILMNPNFPGEERKQFSFDHSYWSHDGFIENPDGSGATQADPMHENGFKYATQVCLMHLLSHFFPPHFPSHPPTDIQMIK